MNESKNDTIKKLISEKFKLQDQVTVLKRELQAEKVRPHKFPVLNTGDVPSLNPAPALLRLETKIIYLERLNEAKQNTINQLLADQKMAIRDAIGMGFEDSVLRIHGGQGHVIFDDSFYALDPEDRKEFLADWIDILTKEYEGE